MNQKIQLFLVLLLGLNLSAWAQPAGKTALLRGRIVNAANQSPANDVQVAIPYLKLLTNTNGEGSFTFSQVAYGTHSLVLGANTFNPDTIKIVINKDVVDLGDIIAKIAEVVPSAQSVQIPTIAIEDNDVSSDDDGAKTQAVSGLLTASRDPFLNTAAYTFGPYRFQPRGYERNQQQVLINGAPMNDVETGDAYWSQWGGLNDVFRARSNTYGLQPSGYTFGGINGSTFFDATASNQRKQTRVTYSLSNRQYRNRLMLTKSSGLMKNGWAYSISLSRRWANEGYVDGTFYDGYSYYAAVSKKIGDKHEINFTTFGAPTRRGKSAPATQEVYDLAGSNFYNPNWGYQNGEKRNAKVANSFQPVFLLNYEYTPNAKTRWNTAVTYQFGKSGNSTLDWYNAKDPRPDYYRYLPSYYALNGMNTADAEFNTNRQIDWDRLYNVNYANNETIRNVNGIAGNDITGHRSIYAVGNDVDKVNKFTFNTNIEKNMNEHVTVAGGLAFISQKTESYREMLDLLGGDFYLNLNQFAVQQNVPNVSFNQYDLNNPNRLIKVGDKYNYDYYNNFQKGWLWAQSVFTYNKVDLFIAANLGYNTFNREGLFRNGLFADNSYGKSTSQNFTTYGAKGGVTYKLNGRNYLFINGAIAADAPTVDNTFISPRTRNITVGNPQVQHTQSMEAGYLLRAPKYNARVVGYVTDVKDATDIKRFYNDDPAYQTFVNYALQNVNMRFIGTELALEARVHPALSITGVASIGQAFYTNNPYVSIYLDNDTVTAARNREVYVKNYYLAAGPQSSYSLGFKYNSKKYWYANVNFNYFDRNYVDVNVDRRTPDAADLIDRNSALYHQIIDQEKLPSAFTMDLSAGKSFLLNRTIKKLPRGTMLYINAGVSNLLNNTNVRTGGFEQLRYDFSGNNPSKFPTKYFYGFGANYFINISLKF